MKKIIFRYLSCFLCISLLLSIIAPVVSASESNSEIEVQRQCPTIYVHGFACGNIYENIGTDKQKQVWPMDSDTIMTAVKTAIPPIISYLLTHNYAKFEDALVEVANILFEPAWNNKDGSIREGTGILWSYPEEIDTENTIYFNYDWRKDPTEVADELNDFIDYVLEKTGEEKVAIECHSMGGVIVMSYIAEYGMNKVHGIVLDSTAIYGAGYIGKLFSGDIVIDGEALYSYLLYAMDETDAEIIVDFIFDSLYAAGIYDIVEFLADELIKRSLERASKEVLIPLFGSWPSIWAMISDEEYEHCEKYVFETAVADEIEEYAGLREKVQHFNTTVRPYKDEIISNLAATNHFMIISKYGYSMAPVTDTWKTMSDGTIDTRYTSYGATCADVGEYLTDDYIAQHESEGYISPDHIVDASTCDYPDNTWFIKDDKHSNNTDALNELKQAVLFGDTPVNIYTYSEYPQYMIRSDGDIIPFTEYEEPKINILYEYGNFMRCVREKIIELFRNIFEKLTSVFEIK